MKSLHFLLVVLAIVALVNGEDITVEQVLNDIQKGDFARLSTDKFTTNPEASAVKFLENVDSIADDHTRSKVILFSGGLMQYSMKKGRQPNENDLDVFASKLVTILQTDKVELVRELAAEQLLENVPPRVLDKHNAGLRRAAEERGEILTLIAYASLPSSDNVWLASFVRAIRVDPTMTMTNWRIDSILGRCGDQSAMDRLISSAKGMKETGDVLRDCLVGALAFVPSDRIQRFLGGGLRSEAVLKSVGGGSIPWRFCFARALVRMHRYDIDFPVKREDYSYSESEMDALEDWSAKNLGISFSSEKRSILRLQPRISGEGIVGGRPSAKENSDSLEDNTDVTTLKDGQNRSAETSLLNNVEMRKEKAPDNSGSYWSGWLAWVGGGIACVLVAFALNIYLHKSRTVGPE